MKIEFFFGSGGFAAMAAGLVLSLQAAGLAAAEPAIRVLLLSGQNNHDWHATTPKLQSILTASGRFTVDVTERPDQCDAAVFSRYDLILSDWNNWGNAKIKEWPAQTREDFLGFVRQGKGHMVVHAGGASFFDWADYQKLTGGSWGKNTGHGPIHAFEVKPANPAHPITQGLGPFRITDELWHRTDLQPGVTVLATAFSAKEKAGSGQDEPVLFASEFGQGRGLTLLLGHNVGAMESAGFQTLLLRGAEWAATGKITLKGPAPEAAADVEAVLKAVAAYRFGESRAALAKAEKLAQDASSDPVARQNLASRFAAMLSSDATVEARQFACGQLSLIGSAAEVPALARLLPDTNFTCQARLALERIPGDESLAALQAALSTTSGQARLGVINSLAARRDEKVVPDLTRLLTGTDVETAGAAMKALGDIGGVRVAQALLAVEPGLPTALKPQLAGALLQCAERLLSRNETGTATPILEKLTATGQETAIRVAAFPLYVSALGEKGADLVLSALAVGDKPMQAAAIRALRTTRNRPLLQAAATRLDTLAAESQAPIIALLGERGEVSALPAVTKAASSKDASVRHPAITTLGSLGNASTVPVLAGLFQTADTDERRLVSEALARLQGGGVDEAMISELKRSAPAVQSALIRVLTERGTTAAYPALIEAAASTNAQVRREAITGLEKVGCASTCAALIGLLDNSSDTAAIESALAAICRRERSVDPIVNALPAATSAKKAVLLGVLGSVGGARALETVRNSARSDAIETRTAAVRALADWPDAAPLDDLAAIGGTTQDPKLKALALRGVAKLAPLAKERSADQLSDLLNRAMAGAEASEQKALLGALGGVPSLNAMKSAATQLKNPALAEEAGLAVLQIVEAIGQEHRTEARAAVTQVMAACKTPAIAERAATCSLRFGEFDNLSRSATATNLDGLTPDGQGSWAQAAIDGNPKTYWDETDNEKLYVIQVKLKQQSRVVFLRILGWQQHNFAPKDFEVLCDNQAVKKVEGATYRNNWLTVDLPPTVCSALTLRITGYYGASPAIRELEIYGKPLPE